ncbi:hypothetical protein AB4Z54_67755, partial [Streptomyces sp. MCAF7]
MISATEELREVLLVARGPGSDPLPMNLSLINGDFTTECGNAYIKIRAAWLDIMLAGPEEVGKHAAHIQDAASFIKGIS